jgi:hypothetical protein
LNCRKKKNDGRITKDELRETIAECQIDLGISFRLAENAQEVCEWLFRYSKAVAKEPYVTEYVKFKNIV